ncbi:MAG: hypothetical protein IH614_13425 [Desulfuromonadales bacterium]|nr:hypothetical protein [Desulfuromonadales bacterium]
MDQMAKCGLVGLLRQPSLFFPNGNASKYLHRQRFIAGLRKSNNTPAREINNASNLTPKPIQIKGLKKARWTNFVNATVRSSPSDVGSHLVKVGLTIDHELQCALDSVLREASLDPNVTHVAGAILSNLTGDLLSESAWSSGQEWEFSPTFSGRIQPGSTYKTFAYLAALESGFTSELQLESYPFESTFLKNNDGKSWKVRNYAETYRGWITLREALQQSDNTAFARLSEIIDPCCLGSAYSRFGFCAPGQVTPAYVLGASQGVSLLDLASAYATIARNGVSITPRFIRFAQYADGSVQHFRSNQESTIIIKDRFAVDELRAALRNSSGLFSSFKLSGKTGTTKNGSIFAGYNDRLSLSIWLNHKITPEETNVKSITAIKTVESLLATGLLAYKKDIFSI